MAFLFWLGIRGARSAVVRPNAFLRRKSAAFSACNAENIRKCNRHGASEACGVSRLSFHFLFSKNECISLVMRPDPDLTQTGVADGLFCREIDGLFCRSSPDIIVRRRCVLSHKRRGWLQPSPSFRYSRNLALQDELYHPVINNGPAVLVCVDKRLGTGPVNQSRDAG